MMLRKRLLFLVVGAQACSIEKIGYWTVKSGETTGLVAQCLGVGVEDIGNLNPLMDVEVVRPGENWKVPFRGSCSSASWVFKSSSDGDSNSCVAYLTFDKLSTSGAIRPRTSMSYNDYNTTRLTTTGTKAAATRDLVNSESLESESLPPRGFTTSVQSTNALIAPTAAASSSTSAEPNRSRPEQTTRATVTSTSGASPSSDSTNSAVPSLRCYSRESNPEFFNIGEEYYTHNETQEACVERFCNLVHNTDFKAGQAKITLHRMYLGNGGKGYVFTAQHLGDNGGLSEKISIESCKSTLRSNFLACINGGLGGETTVNGLSLRYKPENLESLN